MSSPQERQRALLAFLYGEAVGAATYARLQALLEAIRPGTAPQPSATSVNHAAHEGDEAEQGQQRARAGLRGSAAVEAPRPGARLSADHIILITYGDQVQAPGQTPLRALGDLLDTTLDGALSGVHILPFYPYTSDDGFSVVDYLAVDPALGDWADIAALGARYRLMFDAVVNHISASSAWFQAFLAGEPGAAARFHSVDPQLDLSGVTRPRTTPLLTPFATPSGTQHVWTTFSADQIDLNFANPALLLEMTGVLLEYVARGASLIRLDAIGYLWKQIGTRCIHLPQAHAVVQLWRAVLDQVNPAVLLITETNVPHADNISYFGDGSNEAQLVYQFPLAPLVLHAFASGDASRLSMWAAGLAPPSPQTAFFNFLASHDGVGVVPATGILSVDEVAELCARVERHGGRVSYKNNPDGTRSPYELNCTWFDALSDPAANDPQAQAIDRFVASQAIMLSLQGVPGVYVHSLFGSPNNQAGLAETGRNRTLNREKWQRVELDARLANAARREGEVLRRMLRLIRTRRGEAAFDPAVPQRVLNLGASLFALERTPEDGSRVICLHSVAAQPTSVSVTTKPGEAFVDLLSGEGFAANATGDLGLTLAPYAVRWLRSRG